MKWYHFSVEYFEDLRNVNHCEFLIMRRNDDSGKYILENNLRTWSGLKRERELALQAALKEKGEDGKENGNSKDVSTLARSGSTVEIRRRWGGCPNGCNHDKSFKIRQTLADLVKSDHIISNHAVGLAVSESGSSSVSAGSTNTAVPNGNGAVGSTHGITNPSFSGTANSQTIVSRRPASKRFQSQTTDETDNAPDLTVTGPQIDVTKARDEIVSSPDGTPSFISVDDRLRSRIKSPNVPPRPAESAQLHVGRDFGGTYSGHSNPASDDADSSSEDDDNGRHRGAAVITPSSSTTTVVSSPNGTGAATPHASQQQQQQQQQKTLGIPPSAIPLHHRPRTQREREQSRMGRGTRANRLGDHHSSDGEHEADGEHEEEDQDQPGEGSDSGLSSPCCVQDEATGTALIATKEMTDEADEVLSRAEVEERSVRGSVY